MNVRFLLATVLFAFAALLPGHLEAQAAPAALNPVGEYDFTTQIPDMGPAAGVIRIQAGSEGGYVGSITVDAVGQMPVRRVDLQGNKMTLVFASDQGVGTMVLELHGDHYMGSWSVGGMGGQVTATKRKG